MFDFTSWVLALAEFSSAMSLNGDHLLACAIVLIVGILADRATLRWAAASPLDSVDDARGATSVLIRLVVLPPVLVVAAAMNQALSGAEVILWGAAGLALYKAVELFVSLAVRWSITGATLATWPPSKVSTMTATETMWVVCACRLGAAILVAAYIA